MGSKIASILVIVGALNWLLVGLGMFFNGEWNVVHMIFGSLEWLEAVVYILVGIAGVGMLFGGCKGKTCSVEGNSEGHSEGGQM